MKEDTAHQMKRQERGWMDIEVTDLKRKRVRRQVTVQDENSACHAPICLYRERHSFLFLCAVLVLPELLVCDQTTR